MNQMDSIGSSKSHEQPKLPHSHIPRLRSEPLHWPHPHSLSEFRKAEGRDNRKRRLHELWRNLPPSVGASSQLKELADTRGPLTPKKAASLKAIYDNELLCRCISESQSHIGWKEFKEYTEAKETELWHIFHDELDLDGNGWLDTGELHSALKKSGMELTPSMLSEFMTSLSSKTSSDHITFDEFRDFLILLPRRASPSEIYRYFQVRKFMGVDGHGPARDSMEGDVHIRGEDKPPDDGARKVLSMGALGVGLPQIAKSKPEVATCYDIKGSEEEEEEEEEPEEEERHFLDGHTALKFLLAGGVAGAVSRTCTAPFDRLKIFLITRPPELGGAPVDPRAEVTGVRVIGTAVARIYAEGGVLAFWTGNSLSVAKIFPESAIKFFAYESSKRAFAKYWDKVDDPRDISGVSRFLSGGIGGLSSQLSIYPIETLKTQMMCSSSMGQHKRTLFNAARHVWGLGGMRAFYRGLSIGLVGVFPYSAIDMSTFEALKIAYQRSTGKDEPGVMALLAFGSISGSVGATSVYPLNFVRTRLQASGSSGHPQRYTGVWDVTLKTWESGGWKGFYRGLFPTLAKVVPAVSISYVVYEHTKRKLGVS